MPAKKKRKAPLRRPKGGTSDPTQITAVASGTVDVDAALAAKAGLRLKGYAIKEDAGVAAAAELMLLHGATVGAGALIGAHHDLVANGEKERWFDDDGLPIPNGISIDRVSGTTKITLYWKVL